MRDLEFDIKARDRTAAAFDSARSNARGFNGDLDLTVRGLNLAATAAKAFAAGFAVTSLAEFGRLVRQTITEAADLVDMADRVGVSTDDIQRMVYGFGQAGVAAGDVDQILTQWARRIGEAYTQGGRLADVLRANGVSLTDSEGRLRSSVELMRDYAHLIANAGSDQERLTLATLGFGNAGDAMVLALRDGADGMDRLMRSADEAGGVLDSELLQRAAEIDDEFNRLWRNFEVNAKSAILNAAGWLADLQQSLGEYERLRNAAMAGAEVGRLAGMPMPERGGRLASPIDRRIDEAFASAGEARDDALARQLRDRFGQRTVIPPANDNGGGGSAGRAAAASAAREQESAYRRVIDRLEEERAMLGLNASEQRVLAEQRRAGVEAASAQGRAIEALVRSIEAETERLAALETRQREVNESIKWLASSGLDGVLAWAEGAATAEDAARSLASEILRAVTYAALLGEGPLAGMFGGGGGGGNGGLVGMLLGGATRLLGGVGGGVDPWAGYRAEGGPVDPWGTYLVGERGPEVLKMGSRGGTVVSNDDAFGNAPAAAANVTHLTFNVQTPDAQSFLKSRGQVETMLARAVARGQRGL